MNEVSESKRRQEPRPPHFSMLRSYSVADLFTLGNAACGTAAIFACLSYLDGSGSAWLWTAFVLLPLALLLDLADGLVARWRSASRLGADLDSLADVVSFGVAPAVLGYTLGMRGGFDIALLVYFVICGISRLARFNVTAAALSDAQGKPRYYEGIPIPSSVVLVLVLAIAFGSGGVHEQLWLGRFHLLGLEWHPLSLMYGLNGSLMISATLRIRKP